MDKGLFHGIGNSQHESPKEAGMDRMERGGGREEGMSDNCCRGRGKGPISHHP